MARPRGAKLKVAHCIHGLGVGGAQRILQCITELAEPASFDFHVYAAHDGLLRGQIEKKGTKVTLIPRQMHRFDPKWIRLLARAFRLDGIEVAHAHLFGDSLHGLLAARLAGDIPVVLTLHTLATALPTAQRFGYGHLLQHCDRAVACSQAVLRSIQERFPSVSCRTTLVRNGVNIQSFDNSMQAAKPAAIREQLRISADDFVFCNVGRLSPEKGQGDIIEAFSSLPDRARDQCRLVFVGDGPMKDRLSKLAEDRGVSQRIIWAGERQNVASFLGAMDVVVAASRVEGLSITILEAMAASSCIIATKIPGSQEAVGHDQEALLFCPGRIDELVQSMLLAFSDPELRLRLGSTARAKVEQQFSGSRMASEYAVIYRSLSHSR